MVSWKKLKSLKGFKTEIIDTESITTNVFVKNLRNKLNMSQRVFARVLGISEKTVEKWEQGANPVKGASSRLLFLLNKYSYLIDDLYKIHGDFSSDLKTNYSDKFYESYISNSFEEFNDYDDEKIIKNANSYRNNNEFEIRA